MPEVKELIKRIKGEENPKKKISLIEELLSKIYESFFQAPSFSSVINLAKANEVAAYLKKLSKNLKIKGLMLYGSTTVGYARTESDLDFLLIVSDDDYEEWSNKLNEIEEKLEDELGVDIHLQVTTKEALSKFIKKWLGLVKKKEFDKVVVMPRGYRVKPITALQPFYDQQVKVYVDEDGFLDKIMSQVRDEINKVKEELSFEERQKIASSSKMFSKIEDLLKKEERKISEKVAKELFTKKLKQELKKEVASSDNEWYKVVDNFCKRKVKDYEFEKGESIPYIIGSIKDQAASLLARKCKEIKGFPRS